MVPDEDFDFVRWETEIRKVVESALVESYYYDAGREEYLLRTDRDVWRAVEMMRNAKLMHKLLSGEPDA